MAGILGLEGRLPRIILQQGSDLYCKLQGTSVPHTTATTYHVRRTQRTGPFASVGGGSWRSHVAPGWEKNQGWNTALRGPQL